jgi:hypothetical protein
MEMDSGVSVAASSLSDDCKVELESLLAIYGDDGSVVTIHGHTVTLLVESSDGARAAMLECGLNDEYPAKSLSSIACEGKRGVPNEMALALRQHLSATQDTLLGMPVLFSLAEAAKTFLDK